MDEILIRREDAIRVAEAINDSIKDKGKFAAAMLQIPAAPETFDWEGFNCAVCSYPIDSAGHCIIDLAHTVVQAGSTQVEATNGERT